MLLYEEGIVGKWLAMLKEIAPRLARVAFVADSRSGPYRYFLRYAQATAPSLAIELVTTPVANAADIEGAIDSFARGPDSGLFLPPDITTVNQRDLIVALAARHRLPAVYAFREFVTAGGLMSYGTDENDTYRLAASYVDRILNLPVQAPVKYQTVLNLKMLRRPAKVRRLSSGSHPPRGVAPRAMCDQPRDAGPWAATWISLRSNRQRGALQ
jgi:putative ABC transport system substrate-binding protein